MNMVGGNPRVGGGIAQYLLAAYLLLLMTIYLLQVFSPLRINTDAYRLLSMAVSAYEGRGYLVDGHQDTLPLGYPFVVKAFLHLGLARSMMLVLLNLLCLMVGLAVLHRWCNSENLQMSEMLAITFVLSSWVVVKHVTLSLTELRYFGLSSVSLFCICLFYRHEGYGKWRWFAVSAIFGYLALQCRSVALTMFPVLAITALLHRDISPFLRRVIKDPRSILAITCVIVILSVLAWGIIGHTRWYESQFIRRGSYFQSLVASAQGQDILVFLLRNAGYRILEMGEIFANLPHSKTLWPLPIFYAIGLVACCALLRGTWLLLRSKDLLPLALYFLTYTALMCVWPFYDPRFWLPLVAVIVVTLLVTLEDLQERWPIVRFASWSYLAYFCFLGLMALVFSTRISLSGRDFSELYGDGTGRMTYRFAFQNGRSIDMAQVSYTQVRLLQIFEPLARTHGVQEEGQQVGALDR